MNYEEEIKTKMVLYHPLENPTILLMRGQVDSEIVFYDNYREILHKMLDDAIDEFMGFKGNVYLYVVTRCEEHSDYVEKVFVDEEKAIDYCRQFDNKDDEYARSYTKVELTR